MNAYFNLFYMNKSSTMKISFPFLKQHNYLPYLKRQISFKLFWPFLASFLKVEVVSAFSIQEFLILKAKGWTQLQTETIALCSF